MQFSRERWWGWTMEMDDGWRSRGANMPAQRKGGKGQGKNRTGGSETGYK